MKLFTKDAEVMEIGLMMITGGGICVLRVVWLFWAVPKWTNMKTVMLSYPITWTITSLLFVVYYLWYVRKHKIR